jgi:transposase
MRNGSEWRRFFLASPVIRSAANNRLFLEAVLWMARAGAPWRDLPNQFGNWNSTFKRFRRWAKKGVFESLFKVLSGDPDFGIRPDRRNHRPRPSAWDGCKRGTQNQAIGRSRGGLTTKIVALVDALGNLARFVLLPGQRHDSIGAAPLLDGIEIDALIGDKGFDNDWLRKELDERGAIAVIPPKADRRTAIACDFAMYRWRHLVENFFCDLKQYRRIATRYDKTDHSFAAMINLAATVMALK